MNTKIGTDPEGQSFKLSATPELKIGTNSSLGNIFTKNTCIVHHFDATWKDGSLRTYDYFNVTDAMIKRDHPISPQNGDAADCNVALPAASSDNAN